jgi:uncharacterized membrane protein YphA (DoxX/SURF4 family)
MLKKHGINAAKIVVALILLMAGGAKLAGVEEVHQSFSVLGLPGWFGYFIGFCEIAGAIGLFINALSALAAAGISIIMLGAIYFHVMYTPIADSIPSVIILVLSIIIFINKIPMMLKFKS